ncbi:MULTISPECIES: MarR family winged helix-turn-helix transcriptional regulator [unclassified Imperialibacter]|uniref:MarR family winged helix-turn-helix transcriptional regulator n=1 Tax=unclassified Imperialibacter TaxID=2629706 RepID=UPI00125B7A04|nr:MULTISPECIES: MarR family transcriptional regulator [unclassified Imperialibacter]CAD5250515.1 Transcriptional regulator, MarR family [Imperialibacter sp. 75]CAD5286704.1 Transcriptional regulator, MarR family [Imperialibacter sp. 89]VVT05730.1 Transcriptional regulator, MarR family [Imperialibacter sp. EC-SDR9]|tara:strand:+ start:220 stop:651 length:432 start_codon:yes stop_codon:yes gene_type:complete
MKDDLSQVVLFMLDQTNKLAKQYSQKELDKRGAGITVDQWVLLKVIEADPGLSQRDLAEKSIKDPASITRMLDLLEKKGLIQREAIEGNRRQYMITVSKEGQKFINKHMAMVQSHRAKSLEGFSKKEVNKLKDMLLRIQGNMM